MNTTLINRIKSFVWRAGVMAAVSVAAYIMNVADVFKLDPHIIINTAAIVVVGLIFAEGTKYLNNKYSNS